jgi:hypothetical protein
LVRVQATIATATYFASDCSTVADLSCGDAAIVNSLSTIPNRFLGDYARGYAYSGPIEKTINEIPKVDLFICSETIEHLDDPDTVLRQIRQKTKYLVLSTPNGETSDSNPEHYWGWDNEEVAEMLSRAEFDPVIYQEVNFYEPQNIYNYQIWGAK